MKILAIDDNRDNLMTLSALLKDVLPECVVGTADNGPDGINLARSGEPDVILLDIIMPEMDGFEVCRRLKADNVLRDIPVVFLTAIRADQTSRIEALQAGAEAFLSKPLDAQELVAQIRAMCKIRAANRMQRQEKDQLAALVAERTQELQQELAERKRAEFVLRESEDRFKHIFDHSVAGISISLPAGEVHVNQAFSELLGYSREELNKKKWQEVTHPNDIEVTRQMTNPLLSGKQKSVRFTKRYLHRDGSIIWADVGISLRRDTNGRVLYFITTINDITERKQAEDAVALQRSLLTALINSPKDIIIFSLDTNSCYTTFNENHRQEMHRIWNADINLGVNMLDCITVPEARESAKFSINRALQGEAFSEIHHQVTFDIYYECHWNPIFCDTEVVGVTVFIRDISERKRAEEQLRESEQKFRAMVETIPLAIYMSTGAEQIGEYMNPEFRSLFGYTLEDIPTVKHWWPLAYPDTGYRQKISDDWNKKVENAIVRQSSLESIETDVICKDGTKKHIAWGFMTLGGKNYAFGLDLTKRKEAEEERLRLLHILDASLNEIYIFDSVSLKFEYVNHGALKNLGYTLEELRNMTPVDLKPEFTMASFRQLLEPLLRGEKEKILFETVHRRCNGTSYPIEVHLQGIQVEGQQVFLAVIQDISERRQAEAEAQLFTEELARSNVDLQQFAYVASHDLQEPLRMISSYLQLIERRYKDKLDDDANTFIHYAVDGASRLQALINGLLEFSRIKTHGKNFVEVDVRAILDDVCRDLQPLIAESQALVRYGEMPVIRVDAAQIARLFQNLLQNALKFRNERTQPIIDISVESMAGEQVFCVHDNGIGIEPQYFERIFTIFQRLHTREQYPGTGMGLAICRRIVERHRGRIWVESTLGEGTSFYFSIAGETTNAHDN